MPKQCSHPDCVFNVFSKTLCQIHWKQQYSKPITVTAPNKPIYRTKEIKKVSTRQQRINAAYRVLRDAFMKDHPVCMAGWNNCTYWSEQTHHMAGRVGDLMLDSTKWLAVCPTCHQEIELQPERAKRLGLSESRLDKHKNE